MQLLMWHNFNIPLMQQTHTHSWVAAALCVLCLYFVVKYKCNKMAEATFEARVTHSHKYFKLKVLLRHKGIRSTEMLMVF